MLVENDSSSRSSGITGVLRAIRHDVERGVNVWDCAPIGEQFSSSEANRGHSYGDVLLSHAPGA